MHLQQKQSKKISFSDIFPKNFQKTENGIHRLKNLSNDDKSFMADVKRILKSSDVKVVDMQIDPKHRGSGTFETYAVKIKTELGIETVYVVNVLGKKNTQGNISIKGKQFLPNKIFSTDIELTPTELYKELNQYLKNNTSGNIYKLLKSLADLAVKMGKNKKSLSEFNLEVKKLCHGLENIITSQSLYGEVLAMLWEAYYTNGKIICPSSSQEKLYDYGIIVKNKKEGRSVKGNRSGAASIVSLVDNKKKIAKHEKKIYKLFELLGDESIFIVDSILKASKLINSKKLAYIKKMMGNKNPTVADIRDYVSSHKTFKNFILKNKELYSDLRGIPADARKYFGLSQVKSSRNTGALAFKVKPQNLIIYVLCLELVCFLNSNKKYKNMLCKLVHALNGATIKVSIRRPGSLEFKIVKFKNIKEKNISIDNNFSVMNPNDHRLGFKVMVGPDIHYC